MFPGSETRGEIYFAASTKSFVNFASANQICCGDNFTCYGDSCNYCNNSYCCRNNSYCHHNFFGLLRLCKQNVLLRQKNHFLCERKPAESSSE